MDLKCMLSRYSFFLLVLVTVLVFVSARVSQRIEKVGVAPDELAHISYIADAIDGRLPVPDYNGGRIINAGLNYLNHPPLYYSLMGIIGKVTGKRPLEDFQFYRTLSSIINLSALVIFAGAFLFLGVPLFGAMAAIIFAACVPIYLYMFGAINNDGLVNLSVAVVVLGFSVVKDYRNPPRFSGLLIGVGVMIAALTKATGLVFLLALAFTLAVMSRGACFRLFQSRAFFLGFSVPLLLPILYFSRVYSKFGEFFPAPGILYQKDGSGERLSFLAYFVDFCGLLHRHVGVVLSHSSFDPFHHSPVALLFFQIVIYGSLFVGLVQACFGFFDSRRLISKDIFCSFIFGLVLFFLIHAVVTYQGYLGHGKMAGIQVRYYLFSLPFLLISVFFCVFSRGRDLFVYSIFSVAILFFIFFIPEYFSSMLSRAR